MYVELKPKVVANAFYNGELENEVRDLAMVTSLTMGSDADRDLVMREISSIWKYRVYAHKTCSDSCRSCGKKEMNIACIVEATYI